MEEQITAAQKLINTLIEFFVNYSFQVFGALVVLIVGFLLAKWIGGLVLALCTKRKLDITLSKFLSSIVGIVVIGFAAIIALGKFGITITPFVAAIGAVAFGAVYAIQGPLSNYAAGISIILGRPFVVGDTITIVGVSGVVQEVKLACTILMNEDGVRITIPNKHIVGETLQNSKANSVVEGVIGISYGSDPDRAIDVVRETLRQFNEVVQSPSPQVGIQQFADSSVNIAYRYWVPTIKYFHTSMAVNLAVYRAFRTANIEIPFPQRDVHLISQPTNVSS
ncbi:MAG: mechanosensitive ion channel family protein [Candidatus Omnitrophica bacterium]|nr:mechanosensitive ion channel family protein [Candidatus Omnitrophota bacterium]